MTTTAETIIRNLLKSSDALWYERNEGHDWRDAVNAATTYLKPTANNRMSDKTGPQIEVEFGNSVTEGSCNACADHTNAWGGNPHMIVVVNLKSISFRLCRNCRERLLKLLQAAKI